MGEKIICPNTGSIGLVTGINSKNINILFLTKTHQLQLNLIVWRTNTLLSHNIEKAYTNFGKISEVVN